MNRVSLSKPQSLPGECHFLPGTDHRADRSRDQSLAGFPSRLCGIEFTCNSLCGVS